MKWENVYVFISSTFNDMHAERDYLVKRVFPQLSAWCEERRLRLIDIDLRWGVTEADATQNKRVVQVCLDRIDACRPFFLCFLGQRRGWVPENNDVNYETIEQQFPLLVEESKEDELIKGRRPKGKSYLGNNSVTEMEIIHALIDPLHNGILKEKGKDGSKVEHAFFFLREPDYLKELPHPDLEDTYTNKGEKEKDLADRELNCWRDIIIPSTGRPVKKYSVSWNTEESTPEIALPLVVPTTATYGSERWKNAFEHWKKRWEKAGVTVSANGEITDPNELEKAKSYNKQLTKGRLYKFLHENEDIDRIIIYQLQEAITKRFGERKTEQLTPLQKELDQQEQFLRVASEGFIRRTGDFHVLDEYIDENNMERRPLAVTALAGMGKTSLLAHWIDCRKNENTREACIYYRFIGGSDDSVNVERLIRSLLEQMKADGKITTDIPADPSEMMNQLSDFIVEAGKNDKIIIVLDALNQFEAGMDNLYWVPNELPKNVKLIVSFKREEHSSGDDNDFVVNDRMAVYEMKPFENIDDRKALVRAYLGQYFKELDDSRLDELVNAEGADNPLFLKVVLSELRVFGIHNELTEIIRNHFGKSPVSAFNAILNRMEQDPAYSKLQPQKSVSHIFGWIAHSRYGMGVDELADLLVSEELIDNKKDALDTVFVVIRQLRPFLAKRDSKIDFFYESFKIAAKERYTNSHPYSRPSEEWHRSLAEYFETRPMKNRHRLMEQAWQLYKSKKIFPLFTLLTNTAYIVEKQSEKMLMDLIEDYNRYSEITADSLRDITLIKERLRLLAPVLLQYPEIAKQTLLGGLFPIKVLAGMDVLQAEIKEENGVELYCLGGDSYAQTGILQLDSGRFLASSPNGAMLLSIKESSLQIIDSYTFKTLRTYSAKIREENVFMGAVSDTGKIALMDMQGVIYADNMTIQSDKRFLLYSEAGGIITVIDNALCAWAKDKSVIIAGTPNCICIRKSFMAFEMNRNIFVYQLKDKKWIHYSSFSVKEDSPVKSIAISDDLETILTVTLKRQLIRQNIHTGELLTNLSYTLEADLWLTRIPYACGEDAHNRIYIVDSESNAACYDLNTQKGITYQAALEANHPRIFPTGFVTKADEAVLLLPSSAISITSEPEIKEMAGHVGGVSSLGFLNGNKVFTQMRNDGQIIFYNTDGTSAFINRIDEAFPLVAAPCGDCIALSISNHKVGLLNMGEEQFSDNGNMPFPVACEFLDRYSEMLFMGTKNEIKRTRIAAKFEEESVYKTAGREQIMDMAAIDGTHVAIIINTPDIFEFIVGIVSNGIFHELSKIKQCSNLCVSPNGKNICVYGDSSWIINMDTREKKQIDYSCRSACFLSNDILVCAFIENGNMLDFVNIETLQTIRNVYVPDRVMSIATHNNQVLCGLTNGKSVILNVNNQIINQ